MVGLSFQLNRQASGRAELAESPFWDPETGDIWWVDITGRKLLRQDSNTQAIQTWETPEIPGFVVLMASGWPAVGMQTGIYAFDPGTAAFSLLVPFDRAGHRFNDATVDAVGRLWTSTMALDAKVGSAAIQCVTNQRTLTELVGDLTIPNGLAIDLDHGRFYYSDSFRDSQNIWVQQIQASPLSMGETNLFASTIALKGRPDGAALDTRGYYWIAGVDGSELYVFDREGRLDCTISVPVPAPTKIAFFGTSGRSIAMTSKNIGADGGYLAVANLPDSGVAGIVQSYWNA